MTQTLTNIRPTTFVEAPTLSTLLGCNITFADETKQHTGSFKFRAAYNLASKIDNEHIIAASSGNFALALAYACSILGKRCTIVMPSTAAQIKIEGIKKYGGQIEFVDTAKKGRAERLAELAKENPDAYITNAYDNELIIDGNLSLGQEIAQYDEPFHYVISPIGGGGLISGIMLGTNKQDIAHASKQASHTLSQAAHPTVIGAEPALANDAARSLCSGKLIANEIEPQTIADGARTISLGNLNWEIIKSSLKQIIEVPEEKIKEAVKLIYEHTGIKAEPTGALSLGAILVAPSQFKEKNVCCIISGGNVDEEVFQALVK